MFTLPEIKRKFGAFSRVLERVDENSESEDYEMGERGKYRHYKTDEQRQEARRAQKRSWAKSHAEQLRGNLQRWRTDNPERVQELQAENWKRNGQRYNENRRKRNKDKA